MKPKSLISTEAREGNAAFSSEIVSASSPSCLRSSLVVCSETDALPFDSRIAVGRLLSRKILAHRTLSEPLVIAVSPGATEVARGISESLRAPLDLLFSEDVCLPWQRDVVLATVNSDGGRTVDEATCRSLRLSRYFVYNCIAKVENELLRRVRAFRGGNASISRSGKEILLVDDGEARLSHLIASVRSLYKQDVAEVIFATPLANLESAQSVAADVNLCLVLAISDPLRQASAYYSSFPQVSDDQIREALKPQKPPESLPLRAAVAVGY